MCVLVMYFIRKSCIFVYMCVCVKPTSVSLEMGRGCGMGGVFVRVRSVGLVIGWEVISV